MYVEAFIDGAARENGNKYRAACAVVVYDKKKEVARFTRLLGNRTNNEAEYEALINALLILSMSGYQDPIIYSDSAVVVNQVNGKWNIKAPSLIPCYITVKEIQEEYNFRLIQVPRKQVFIPDELCNKILDIEGSFTNG